jgi:hypothetical protein
MKAIKIFKEIQYKKYIAFLLIFLLCLIYLSFYIYKFEFRKPLLEINFLSSSRSRSIFIKTPKGKNILIGAGDKEIIRNITELIPFYKRNIHYVFIPSAVPNQNNGLTDIFKRYDIGKVFIGRIIATSTSINQINKIIKENKIEVQQVKLGDNFDIDDIKIEILFPDLDFKFNKTSLPELGLLISYKNTNAYLLGNLSKTIQKSIYKNLINKKDTSEIEQRDNIVELFNSGIENKKSEDLFNLINPKYIQTTKTKTTTWFSNGSSWERGY